MATIRIQYDEKFLKAVIDAGKLLPLDESITKLTLWDLEDLSKMGNKPEQVGQSFYVQGNLGRAQIDKLLAVYTPPRADSYRVEHKRKDNGTLLTFYSTKPIEKIVVE